MSGSDHRCSGGSAGSVAYGIALSVGLLLAASSTAAAQDPPRAPSAVAGMPDLVGALRATSGVLGVETAVTASGKHVIFAWFEDKAAVLRWYYSETHRAVQDLFVPERGPHTPLAHIAADSGPILAVASLTMSASPVVDGVDLPVSQIAIELYQPLPGGLALGGRFAPSTLEVPFLLEVEPPHH
jgi:hypothetical protein